MLCLQDAAVLARQKASVLIEAILQSHYKRTSLIQNYRSVITSFKSGKDSSSFNSNKRGLDDKFKTLGEKVSQLGKDVQPTDADCAAKVSSVQGVGLQELTLPVCLQVMDIQRKMVEVKTHLDESWYLAERVVKGSVTKQQYVEQNKKVEAKMERILQEISNIVQTM